MPFCMLQHLITPLFFMAADDKGSGGEGGDDPPSDDDKDKSKKPSIFDQLGEGDDDIPEITEYDPKAFQEMQKELRVLKRNEEIREAQQDFKDEYPDATEGQALEFVEAVYNRDTKQINTIIADLNKKKEEGKDKDKSKKTPVLNDGDSDDATDNKKSGTDKAKGNFMKALFSK